jgi:hypothetical protein
MLITYECLIAAIDLTNDKVLNGSWSVNVVQANLRVNRLNLLVIVDGVVESASNLRHL